MRKGIVVVSNLYKFYVFEINWLELKNKDILWFMSGKIVSS